MGPGGAGGAPVLRGATPATAGRVGALPALPYAATWMPPDLLLLRAGLLDADQAEAAACWCRWTTRPRRSGARNCWPR
ncbi:hypothetical protein [Streptomyces galbus]|uniref:hypothetical protein n=1 Tax=Streptomyces galbus TaxID=33898 RepID=UPI00406BDB26